MPLLNTPEGLHGTGSRFLPLLQLGDDEVTPRIVQVAGVLPGLSPADVLAPESSPPAPLGAFRFPACLDAACDPPACLAGAGVGARARAGHCSDSLTHLPFQCLALSCLSQLALTVISGPVSRCRGRNVAV